MSLEKKINVKSESIRSLSYNPIRKTLDVEFVNGGVYRYFQVAERIFSEFLAAPSKGRYFIERIRNFYPFMREA